MAGAQTEVAPLGEPSDEATAPTTLEQAVALAHSQRRPVQGPPWPVVTDKSPDHGDVFAVVVHDDGARRWAVGFNLSPVSASRLSEWRSTAFLLREIDTVQPLGMTGETIRSLPLGEMLAAARRAASVMRRGNSERGGQGDDSLSFEALLTPWREDHPRGSARDDDAYAALAVAYAMLVQDGDRKPAATLAARLGRTSARTMVNRITEARRRGMLTSARPGEAAGTATPKAWSLVGVHDR
jgi:hypothetical protein